MTSAKSWEGESLLQVDLFFKHPLTGPHFNLPILLAQCVGFLTNPRGVHSSGAQLRLGIPISGPGFSTSVPCQRAQACWLI